MKNKYFFYLYFILLCNFLFRLAKVIICHVFFENFVTNSRLPHRDSREKILCAKRRFEMYLFCKSCFRIKKSDFRTCKSRFLNRVLHESPQKSVTPCTRPARFSAGEAERFFT